jgi:hypothetical protein
MFHPSFFPLLFQLYLHAKGAYCVNSGHYWTVNLIAPFSFAIYIVTTNLLDGHC